jgi:hypothetical protein
LKQYKEPPQPLFYLLILVYFFILLEAMSESTFEKLKQEAMERELERKVEAFRRKHVERERTK